MQSSKDTFLIWNTISMAWTEIGLDDSDYPIEAKKIKEAGFSWQEVDNLIFKEICWSFSLESIVPLFILIPIIGMFAIAFLPDWGYEEEYLRERITKWHKKSLLKYINPFRVFGYILALLFTFNLRRKLKKVYHILPYK